jgi:hypothetical protein
LNLILLRVAGRLRDDFDLSKNAASRRIPTVSVQQIDAEIRIPDSAKHAANSRETCNFVSHEHVAQK